MSLAYQLFFSSSERAVSNEPGTQFHRFSKTEENIEDIKITTD